jgi:hypothetical protein
MRAALVLALSGLLLCEARAQVRDLAAEPAYPSAPEAAAPKPKMKHTHKPAAKPVAAKPAAAPVPKPSPNIKAEAKPASPAPPADPFPKLPAAERAAIRAALLWSSGEDGKPGDGEDPMISAIKAYQKRNKAKVTGVLTEAERAELLAAARTHADEFGWSVVVDPATGIRLGIPGKLAALTREAPHGTRWASRHGEIAVETFRIKTDQSLTALFEAQKKQPRQVESSYSRADSFFVSGLQGLKLFAVRAQLKDGELRGYTMLYDQAMAGIVLPVLGPMANAFAPFPDGAAPLAALARPVAYGTGVIVSESGHVLTDRRIADGCDVVTIPGLGNAERVALDDAHGLALLRVYGKHKLKSIALTENDVQRGSLKLTGIPDPNTQNGGARRLTIAAQLADGNAIRLRDSVPLAGFSGAAALDAQGRLLGIMEMRGARLASVEPAAAPMRLTPAAAIRDFLTAHQVAPAHDSAGEAAIVRVICVRH